MIGGEEVEEAKGLFHENSVYIVYKKSESPHDKLHSHALEEDCQGEMDELSGQYLNKLSSSMEKDSHGERRTEDSTTHSPEFLIREDDNRTEKTNGNVDLDVRSSSPSDEKLNMLQEISFQEEGELRDENYDSPTLRVGEKSVSPGSASKRHKLSGGDGTLSLQEDIIHKVSNPPSSPRHRESSSPKRSDQNTYLSRSRPKDGSSRIRRSLSPSPRKHGRLRKSVSRSPVRRRDTSSRHKRDRSHRSRSRSPYKRDHGISSRGRHSPRRRSPPTYHLSRHSPRSKPWAPPPNRRTGLGKPGNILFVAGFNFMTTEGDLKRKFSRFGRVRDVRIVRDKRSGDSRGFGFITLERDEDADAAIKALDETEWNGRIILVEKSKSH